MSLADIETILRFIQHLLMFAIYESGFRVIWEIAMENYEVLEKMLYFSRYGELTDKMIEPMLTSTTLLVDNLVFIVVGPWILYRINKKTMKAAFFITLPIVPFVVEYGFPVSAIWYWLCNPHEQTRDALDFLVGPEPNLIHTAEWCSFLLIFAFVAAIPPVLICFPHVIFSWVSMQLKKMRSWNSRSK